MSNFSPVDWSRAIVNKQYRPLNTVFNFQNRKSMNPACWWSSEGNSIVTRYSFKHSRMREWWGYYWHLLSLLVTALHLPYTQNLCDLLKLILAIKLSIIPSLTKILLISSHNLIYIKLLIQIFLLSLCKGVPQWRYWLLKLLFILNLQTNISTFYAHHVTPHTLNELFHSALPWEYDVYVHSMRRSNCIVMNQHKHNTLTDVDTISVSSARRYNVFIQCVLSNTFTQATHPHVPF